MSQIWWRRWLRAKFRGPARGNRQAQRRRSAPFLAGPEALEARNLLSLNFAPPVQFVTGAGPSFVVTGDVNSDGRLDVITTNTGNDNVSVLLGNGNGTFSPQSVFSTVIRPTAVAVGDFRHNGKLDLVVAGNNQFMAGIMLGNGNGSFQAVQNFSAGSGSYGVAVGDFNGDGKLDAAVTDYSNNRLNVLLGQGDGTFQSQNSFAAGSNPGRIVVGDFNHDGKLDIAVQNVSSNNVSVLLGNGNGLFQAEQTFAIGTQPRALATADLNHDGNLDLVAANRGGNSASVLLGNGNGTFQGQQSFATGSAPTAVTLADFDGDGRLDIATSNYTSNNATVLLGNGNGTFKLPLAFAASSSPMGITANDLNRDGAPDLVVANFGANNVSVLLNLPPSPHFLFFGSQTTFTTGTTPVAEATGDLNHDSNPDVVTANRDSNTISVLLGNGNGTFQNKFVLPAGVQPTALQVGDLDGDGNFDVVVANAGSNSVSVILGNGDGTFKNQSVFPVGNLPDAVTFGDFDGDGKADLAVANALDNSVSVLLGNGNGALQNQRTFAVGVGPSSLAVGDFNGDGKQDLVVTNFMSDSMSLLLGNGNGTFLGQQVTATGANPRSIITADFNKDSKLDVAFANENGNTVSVLRGNGNGTFLPGQNFQTGIVPTSVVTGDFNTDTNLDLAVTNTGANTVSVLLGAGTGSFGAQTAFPTGVSPFGAVIGFFNSDFNLDVAVANGSSNDVTVLLGNGNGAFQFHRTFGTGANPHGVAVGDLNNDSKIDVAVANTNSDTVGILLGLGNGTLQAQLSVAVGAGPTAVALGNFNGLIGIAVVNSLGNSVSVITTNNVFVPPLAVQSFAVGVNPQAIAVGDFNADGKQDLAVANYDSNSVSVLLGNGDGTFSPHVTFAVGSQPDAVVIADFNGDSKRDVAVANYGGSNVSVLLGNGTGTFQPQATYATGARPSSMVVQDFNGDFSNDLVTTNIGANSISVLLGKPDGTFLPQLTFTAGAAPTGAAIGDYNNDDILDLSVSNLASNTVSVLLGNGNGTFQGQQTFSTALGALAIATADFNNDSKVGSVKLDFVVSHPSQDTVAILLGNGNGTFQNALNLAAGEGAFASATGDFNGDKILDFAVTNPLKNTVSVVLGHGDGSFQNPVLYATGSLPKSVFTADINGDGKLDLIVANTADNTVGVLLGAGNGAFQAQITSATQLAPLTVAVGDFNADKNADLVVTNAVSNTVSVLLGNSNGTFLNQQPYNVGFGPYGVVVGNFNGDTILDLAVTNVAGNNISVLLGNANGTFQAQRTFGAGIKPAAIALGDFNGDTKLDLAVANYGSSNASVLLGNGNGTFRSQIVLVTGVNSSALTVGDFNGDSKQDLAVANYGSNTISVLRGNGNGSFRNPLQVQTGAGPLSLLAGSFFSTNNTDLISLHSGANLLSGLQGNGDGTFRLQQSYATGQAPTAVVLGDFNNDGKLDIAAANDRSVSVSIFIGNGDGLISNQTTFATSGPADSIVEGDFNGDGKLDLVVNNAGGSTIGVFLGYGNGTFQPQLLFGTPGAGPGKLVAGDFNNNGKLDLAVLRTDSNIISLLNGNGNGTFQTAGQPTVAVPAGTISMALGDFNNDGKLDLAAGTTGGAVVVLLGNANGTFQTQQTNLPGLGGIVTSLTSGDFNSDGRHDLGVVTVGPDSLYILQGNNDGTFSTAQILDTGEVPRGVKTGDFNADGKIDLAAANFANNSVSVFAGNGNGTFQNQQTFLAGTGPTALAVGDLSNDGTADIVTANRLSNNVALLLNNPQAVHFSLVAPASVTAGVPFNITVIAQDAGLNPAVGYTGTITFTSSDSLAGLPANYTFVVADNGVHTFSATLKRSGNQSITATDVSNPALVGTLPINVAPGAARSYGVSAPAGALASVPFSVAVTAFDLFGNTAVGYAGTVRFTSSDPAATLPANYTFTAADQGVHIFTNGVTLRTVGSMSITATDTVNASINGAASVNVSPATGDHFSIGVPASVSTGQFFSVTVTALNANNQTDVNYTGTVHFTSTDSVASLPADYTFLPSDGGVHTFNNVQLLTLGSQTISATDTVNSQVKGSAAVLVNALATTHFSIGLPATTVAGIPFNFSVTALTATGQVDSNYRGTVHFTTSDLSAGVVLPADYTFTFVDGGVHQFSATLNRSGPQTLSVLDTVLPQVAGTGSITVNPAAASQLLLRAINLDSDPVKIGNAVTANVFANFPFTLSLSAVDAFGNLATGYNRTVRFTSTDPGAGVVLPGDYTFTAADGGTHLFPLGATLTSVGARTITATDLSQGSVNGSYGVSVSVPATDVIMTFVPANVPANTPFNITVTAFRPDHTIDTNFVGTVRFTSSDPDPRVTLPAEYTFTAADGGTHAFTSAAVLATVGFEKVTARDTAGALNFISGFLNVTPGVPTHFAISAPSTNQAGEPFSLRVTALDAFNNTVTGYTGTVQFSTTDPAAGIFLPATYTFTAADAGVHTFVNNSAPILRTAGTQLITASDMANAQLVSSTPVLITPAPASFFDIVPAAVTSARFPFNVTVTARDPFNNVVTNYTGTVSFSNTDPLAVLPVNYTFTLADAGVHTFPGGVTLQTLGAQSVTVRDTTALYSIQGRATIPVSAETQTTFILQAPVVVNNAIPFSFTVTAIAPNGTIDTGYQGSVFFSTSNPGGSIPAFYTFQASDAGVHTFTRGIDGATFFNGTTTPRFDSLTVTDFSRTTTTTIQVNPAASDTYVVSGPSRVTVGVPFSLQVTVLTPAGNVDPNYAGTIHFTSSDPLAILPADYTFTSGFPGSDSGMHSFNGLTTLNTPGPKVITARDTSNGLILGTVTVVATPAPTDTFRLIYPAGATVGAPFTVTAVALRPDGTVDTTYTGTLRFTSSDPLATLPLDYSFQPGENGVHTFTNGVTLRTPGAQTLIATETSLLAVEGTNTVLVTPAANDLLVISMPSSVTAGDPFTFTVTAYDAFHNVDAGYTGTVRFTTTDPSGSVVLPIDYIFTPGDRGTHTFTLGATLITGPQAAGQTQTQTLIATDIVTAAITGQFTATVVASTADHLTIAAPPTQASGTPFTATLTVLDRFNNVKTNYLGSVRFTSNDATTVLPADYTFTAPDGGAHVFTDAFILKTVNAAATITATDKLQTTVTGTAIVNVTPQAGNLLQLTAPGQVGAGSFDVIVTAIAPGGGIDTAYTGTVRFTATDPAASLPLDYTFTVADQGVHRFINGVIFQTQGLQVLTVTDTAAGNTKASANLVVGPAVTNTLVITMPASRGVGQPFNITVTAMKGSVVDTQYAGTIHFTSNVPGGVVPPDYTFTPLDRGAHTFVNGGLFTLAGAQTVTARDTVASTTQGSGVIQMIPAAADHFAVSAPPSTSAGAPFTVTVTALDPFNNVVTNFSDKIQFTSTDQAASLPVNYGFTFADAGVHTFASGVSLVTTGPQSITVINTANSSVQGTASVIVNQGTNNLFSVSAPGSSPAGSAFTVTVTVFDAQGNVDTGYTGTVHFTSSDPNAVLPPDFAFTPTDLGRHTFTNAFVLTAAGSQTITATDAINPLIKGSAPVTVNLAQSNLLKIAGPGTSVQGVPFSITVSALDPFLNVDPSYRGTIHFTSSDNAAVLPANYTFVAADGGVHTFTGVTLATIGQQSLTATDTATASITGSAFVTNNPVAPDHFFVAVPGNTAPGVPFTIVVTALGAQDSVATSYIGTVHFTSSDTLAGLPADYTFTVLDRGQKIFTAGASLSTPGNQTITATDTRTSSIQGTSGPVIVSPTVASKFNFIFAPVNVGANTPFNVTIQAVDSGNNPFTGYLRTVNFTSDDPLAVLPPTYTFTAADQGAHFFTGLQLGTLGSHTVTVTDFFTPSITGTQTIQVSQVAVDHFQITNAPSSVFTAQPFSITVTAVDTANAPVAGYRGTVHFASTDLAAVLPTDYTFTAADAGSHTFSAIVLNTAGAQTISVNDTNTTAVKGTILINVNPILATNFSVVAPAAASPGALFTVTVTALDQSNNPVTGFTGTIHFSSSDVAAGVVLPADYTFTLQDAGVHTFTNAAALKTPGTQFVTVTDTAHTGVTGTASIVVSSGIVQQNIIVTGAERGGGPNVVVFDAATNAVKFNFFAYDPNFTGGVRVAVGDVNADSIPDIITAAGPGGGPDIHVYDGVSGGLIRQFFAYDPNFTGGVFLASGDVNADGAADIICGADAGGGPNISVYSGRDLALLATFFAYDPGFTGGVRVGAGDINADGRADIICGAGAGGGPNVAVYSGLDFQLLRSFFAFDSRFTGGVYVAGGDVSGDGRADILVGAGAGGGPNVTAFSGLDNSLVYTSFPFDPRFTGGVRVGSVDRLGNGAVALVAVPGPGGGPDVVVLGGLTPVLVDEFFAVNPLFTGGLYVAGSGH